MCYVSTSRPTAAVTFGSAQTFRDTLLPLDELALFTRVCSQHAVRLQGLSCVATQCWAHAHAVEAAAHQQHHPASDAWLSIPVSPRPEGKRGLGQ